MLTLKVFVEETGKAPQLGRPGDAAFDVFANLSEPTIIHQFGQCKISLGFRFSFWELGELSFNHWMEIKNRSGVGIKSGMTELASVIDASYRGIPHFCAAKITPGTFTINHGDKIAQAIIHPFVDPYKIKIQIVKTIEELGSSERGDAGFGSSGSV